MTHAQIVAAARYSVTNVDDARHSHHGVYSQRARLKDCPRCYGNGTIPVAGESLNPRTGVRSFDPQEETEARCPRCRGEGVIRSAA